MFLYLFLNNKKLCNHQSILGKDLIWKDSCLCGFLAIMLRNFFYFLKEKANAFITCLEFHYMYYENDVEGTAKWK